MAGSHGSSVLTFFRKPHSVLVPHLLREQRYIAAFLLASVSALAEGGAGSDLLHHQRLNVLWFSSTLQLRNTPAGRPGAQWPRTLVVHLYRRVLNADHSMWALMSLKDDRRVPRLSHSILLWQTSAIPPPDPIHRFLFLTFLYCALGPDLRAELPECKSCQSLSRVVIQCTFDE